MKSFLNFIAFVLFGTGTCFAQSGVINFDRLRFNNLAFYSSRARIVQRLGKPVSIAEPQYECGAYSSAEQGKKFYELRYGQAAFIGTATSQYQLDRVTFTDGQDEVLTYGQHRFSHQTSVQDLKQIFGPSLKLTPQKGNKVLVFVTAKDKENGAVFTFIAGQLTRFEFWSPC